MLVSHLVSIIFLKFLFATKFLPCKLDFNRGFKNFGFIDFWLGLCLLHQSEAVKIFPANQKVCGIPHTFWSLHSKNSVAMVFVFPKTLHVVVFKSFPRIFLKFCCGVCFFQKLCMLWCSKLVSQRFSQNFVSYGVSQVISQEFPNFVCWLLNFFSRIFLKFCYGVCFSKNFACYVVPNLFLKGFSKLYILWCFSTHFPEFFKFCMLVTQLVSQSFPKILLWC